MCQSIAEGGMRCAAHTRPAFEAAIPNTPEWDDAAAAYGATREGTKRLAELRDSAEASGDIGQSVALQVALDRGTTLRRVADEVRSRIEDGQMTAATSSREDPYEERYTDAKGQLHRIDGPAYIGGGGDTKKWYSHGRPHRAGGPAIEHSYGHYEYFVDGIRHNPDGPALIAPSSGITAYYVDGRLHREDGPAEIYSKDGAYGERWYRHGEPYRADGGPAWTEPNGTKHWFENGIPVRLETADGVVTDWRTAAPPPPAQYSSGA